MKNFEGIDSIDDAFERDNNDFDPNETRTWEIPAENDLVMENAQLTYENELLTKTNTLLNTQYGILEQVANEIVTERDAARQEARQYLAPSKAKNWFALGTMASAFGLGMYALRTMDPIAVYSAMTLAGLGVGLGITRQGTEQKTPRPKPEAQEQSPPIKDERYFMYPDF